MNLSNLESTFRAFNEAVMTAADQAHDITHIMRVVATAKQICKEEQASLDIVLPAAWLHDCFTHTKNHPERHLSSQIAADKAIEFLGSIGYQEQYFDAIHHAIISHSFSANIPPQTIEAKIVQDADRLDSLGAIGIIRTILTGASFGASPYCPSDPFAEYRELDDKAFIIDHFHTKLFKLIESLNTTSAQREGERRTRFMKDFLAQLGTEV